MKIGIACYPSVGGSGILATALGEELARRGHEVHFFSYERPFRLPTDVPRLHFHPVVINEYQLFKYPDYTLPLSVRMAEVSRDHRLDVLHVHYAVPHATAAILAQSMLPPEQRPRVVTTLHGTDTTLLGSDPGYGPAIHHALTCSNAVTVVSEFLKQETQRVLGFTRPLEVIYNFFVPRPPRRSRVEVRRELGLADNEAMILHSSNVRPVKRIDLLLESVARVRPRDAFKLVVLAGGDFAPYAGDVRRLGLADRVIVREKVNEIEDYLQAADLGLFTSETESFCLSILEAMCFGCPSVARRAGGIPEVVEDTVSGLLVSSDNPDTLARAIEGLIREPGRRAMMGQAAQRRARERFSAGVIVPQYEALYRKVCG
ncbi:MAG TPA: N-acetyl-alpha-D-glucosaminyl L-malate synthase BshA [Candidatus Acidoferrales bacterium]|nr:N-acetyl-alpha-D-glucosaminyl L-malate synthase BshA [Candidatus Acidoferrales bacterium]